MHTFVISPYKFYIFYFRTFPTQYIIFLLMGLSQIETNIAMQAIPTAPENVALLPILSIRKYAATRPGENIADLLNH